MSSAEIKAGAGAGAGSGVVASGSVVSGSGAIQGDVVVGARKIFNRSYVPSCPYTNEELIREAIRQNSGQQRTSSMSLDVDITPESEESRSVIDFNIEGANYTLSVANGEDQIEIKIESLIRKMAEVANINIAPWCMIETADGAAALITRRTQYGARRKPLKMIQIDEIGSATPLISAKSIAEAIATRSTAPKLDKINLFEILYFSWLVGDRSFDIDRLRMVLSVDRYWSLAPIMHFTSAELLSTLQGGEAHISINGKREDIAAEEFAEAMATCGIEAKIFENMRAKFSALIDTWCDMIEESDLPEELGERFKFMLFIKS